MSCNIDIYESGDVIKIRSDLDLCDLSKKIGLLLKQADDRLEIKVHVSEYKTYTM